MVTKEEFMNSIEGYEYVSHKVRKNFSANGWAVYGTFENGEKFDIFLSDYDLDIEDNPDNVTEEMLDEKAYEQYMEENE